MRKLCLMFAALAGLSAGSVAMADPEPGPCQNARYESTRDPFGSCEDKNGDVTCSDGGTAAGGFTFTVDEGKGAQVCGEDEAPQGMEGRYTVLLPSSGNQHEEDVVVGLDGGDGNTNPVFGDGFIRAEGRTDSRSVCLFQGADGSYWIGPGNHDRSAENTGAPVVPLPSEVNPTPGVGTTGTSQCVGTPTPPAQG